MESQFSFQCLKLMYFPLEFKREATRPGVLWGLLMGSGHTVCGQELQLHIPETLFPHRGPAHISFVFIRGFLLLFIYLFLAVLGLRCYAGNDVRASHFGGFSCCSERTLGCIGFSSCGTWALQLEFPGSRPQPQQFWHTGLVALQHAGSS